MGASARFATRIVWTLDQRRALIQSLYTGVPVGNIIVSKLPFRAGNPYHYRVIDGKQRIETVRAFAASEFTVPGWWFTHDLTVRRSGEITWEDLTDSGHRHFTMATPLPALELDAANEWLGRDEYGKRGRRKRSDAEILAAEAEVYLLVNGGGTMQSESDMARAAEVASGRPSDTKKWSEASDLGLRQRSPRRDP